MLTSSWEEVRIAETEYLLKTERESVHRHSILPRWKIPVLSFIKTFEQALRTREFEPDAPNYTPRISGIMNVEGGKYDFAMSILKSNNGDPSSCQRFTYSYENPKAGEGYFIHTYMKDANPLPSYEGEPTLVNIEGDIDTFTNNVWEALNEDNKVSLFTRFIDIETGKYETRIINKETRQFGYHIIGESI